MALKYRVFWTQKLMLSMIPPSSVVDLLVGERRAQVLEVDLLVLLVDAIYGVLHRVLDSLLLGGCRPQ